MHEITSIDCNNEGIWKAEDVLICHTKRFGPWQHMTYRNMTEIYNNVMNGVDVDVIPNGVGHFRCGNPT